MSVEELLAELKALIIHIEPILALPVRSVADLSLVCHQINAYLQTHYKDQYPAAYYFIRGSLWHFLHAGFSHACALKSAKARKVFLNTWQKEFKDFVSRLDEHYRKILFKDFDLNKDKWLTRSITDSETDTAVACFADFYWQPLNFIVDNNGTLIEYKANGSL